jgi:hypothetical protein
MERANEFLAAVKPDGVSWSGRGHALVVAGSKISLDGKSCGVAKSGDVVRVTPEGALFVNDEKRSTDR